MKKSVIKVIGVLATIVLGASLTSLFFAGLGWLEQMDVYLGTPTPANRIYYPVFGTVISIIVLFILVFLADIDVKIRMGFEDESTDEKQPVE